MHIDITVSVPIDEKEIAKIQQQRSCSREQAILLLGQRLEFAAADSLRWIDGVQALSLASTHVIAA